MWKVCYIANNAVYYWKERFGINADKIITLRISHICVSSFFFLNQIADRNVKVQGPHVDRGPHFVLL
jgi:hypothetical protein